MRVAVVDRFGRNPIDHLKLIKTRGVGHLKPQQSTEHIACKQA